ncbi:MULTISPECIES: outer membrane beta-barrel protein [Sphingomonas]|jgi:outer membrane immunogenic protein|uniref:Porin family protein n=1 Tax=Sphingomonas alpina TaxID=653931 RepID=A0A7H0LF50_9SPHN|nr:outer membrane beta-barrel protein [Sphingomonas alpina]QNQ08303.1 porin family protein [Sphingomonas alpina]
MKIKFLLASVAMLAVATPAMAQDATEEFKGGARVEARVGVDHVRLSFDGDSVGRTGFDYGVEAGYDAALSGFVVGAYAGIEGSTTKACELGTCLKAGRNITAGVRVGGVVGKGLLYAKGGYSNGRLSIEDTDLAGNADGFHLGVGYEVNVSANTYVKAEYVYTNYSVGDIAGDDLDLQRHQGLIGVGFRF